MKDNRKMIVISVLVISIFVLNYAYVSGLAASRTVTETVTTKEIVSVRAPGVVSEIVVRGGTSNEIKAVKELSALIRTGAQKDGTVSFSALIATETRSGKLPSASFLCVPGKILKVEPTVTLQNFNIQIYFDATDISVFQENTLQLFFYENQLGQNLWIELPIDIKGVDEFGHFVQAKPPRTLDPTKASAEYFCLAGVKK